MNSTVDLKPNESSKPDEIILESTGIQGEPMLVDYSNIRNYKLNIFLWSLYDLANTIYSMGIVSLVLVPLITIVSIASFAGVDPATLIANSATVTKADYIAGTNYANLIYLIVVIIGNALMIVLSPIIGAYADQLSKRKYLLGLITIFTLVFISAIAIKLSVIWILTMFLLANLTYQTCLVIYDSMIPFIAKPQHTSKASGFGIAFGYFGSFIAIGISFIMASGGNDYSLDEDLRMIKIGYIQEYIPIVAIAFLILGFPILFTTEARGEHRSPSFRELVRKTFEDLRKTLREVWQVADSRYFLIGWLLFVDAANVTIAYMSVLVTLGLGLPPSTVTFVLAIGIASAVIFTYPVGYIGDRIGPKKLFYLVGFLWISALFVGIITNLHVFGMTTPAYFAYIMAVIVGPGLGGTWVAQRQMITELAPKDRSSNYFGIANVFGRISSIIGPAIVTLTLWILTKLLHQDLNTSYRVVMGVLALLLLIGLSIITRVTDHHEKYVSGYLHIGEGEWVQFEN